MSHLIALAWPLVALLAISLLVWRADVWARMRWSHRKALEELGSAHGAVERRVAEIESTTKVRQAGLADALSDIAKRLEKLESVNKTPAPAANSRTAESLNRFR